MLENGVLLCDCGCKQVQQCSRDIKMQDAAGTMVLEPGGMLGCLVTDEARLLATILPHDDICDLCEHSL